MAYANQTSAKTDHDIIIVGLGPTGATLANILGGYGLDVLVLEREASVYPLPRAVHFDDEALRVFQSIGLAEKNE
jgi:3-(3-hydroxy-phenyl)propionate hydroxylase